ncbi:Outer membrane receptor proteins, mostly Fe transport [Filimonas lacunae]|uniref:Outer membrane receptor proteins, mostly Fe transport n=1 Tax=Filimonas lacunae TaxID=477680 RepID=A0A173MKV4_9BACT|nr:outer membrane beta-barrel family protein [Filimonas lacunae]BAV08028.1 TonB-dependent receptor [Filimonas lacunae]SIT08224.1 Outer membrane receptor proteins, mostly Fe transport [Filimonas lacunae]
MKLFYLLPVWLLLPVLAKGQLKREFTLTDSIARTPVAYATVYVYNQYDTAKPVQQLISKENGSFTVNLSDTAHYLLSILHTNYQEQRLALTSHLPATILLTAVNNTPGAVTVTGTRKMLVEKKEDKLVFNVENDVSLDGQMATDALRKTPFLSVDGEGNVQLKGQSNFKILLNGKESGLFSRDPKEALKSFPASSIKKIEVITSPSAKYDAEGVGGIINIITKKAVTGYNASSSINISNYRHNEYFSLNVKYGKLGFTGSFSNGRGHNSNYKNYSYTRSLHPVAYTERILDGTGNNRYNWQSGSVELSYDIDSLHTLSVYGNIGTNPFSREVNRNVTVVGTNITDTARSLFQEFGRFESRYNDFGLDYIQKFAHHPNKEWSFKMNRQYSDDVSNNDNNQYALDYTYFVRNNNRERNTQYVLQTDLVLPMAHDRKLELGLKSILRNANANYAASYNNGGDKFTEDEANTNRFNYTQNVWSSYFTYTMKIHGYSLKAGSRLEQTTINGSFKSINDRLHQNYYNYIPTLYLSRKFKDKHDVSLSYSKRLRRPYIWDLNPFVNNIDTLNITSGNPALKPEVTHSLELSYSYFKNSNSLSVILSQNICNSQIIRYTIFNDATGVATIIPYNIGENRFTAVSINANLKLYTIWSLNLNAGVQYNRVKNRNDPSQQNQGFSGNGNLSSTIDITKKFSFFNSGGYWQSPIQLQGKYPFNYWYDAGVSYKLLNNQLRISLRANSFLQKYMPFTRKFSDANFIQQTTNSFIQRNFVLNVKWNFGKLSESTSRKRGVKTDDIQK